MKSSGNGALELKYESKKPFDKGRIKNDQAEYNGSYQYQSFTSKNFLLKIRHWLSSYKKFIGNFERYLAPVVLVSFVLGVLISDLPGVANVVFNVMDGFIEFYASFAPVIIFIILAPSLSQMVNTRKKKKGGFISYAIIWLSLRRLLSLFWAVIFTWIVFGLSFYEQGDSGGLLTSLKTTGSNLVHMFLTSHYFYAMYLAVASLFVARKFKPFEIFMRRLLHGVEYLGQYLIPIIPAFMLAIGIYVSQVDTRLNDQIVNGYNDQIDNLLVVENRTPEMNQNLKELYVLKEKTISEPFSIKQLSILGWKPIKTGEYSMVWTYVAISMLIGVACIIWHFGLLVITKYKVKDFSIKKYFKGYWIKVYPLLWATSSEALAMPLNLYLVKRHYPKVNTKVRQFTIGVGSYLSINGTMICVIVLAGAVANILGVNLTAIQLLLSIPLVFLIGFGVPGIPGELLLFAGPLLELFDLAPQVQPVFMAMYLGLQIGLPDSFRTGNNSTDDCVMSILLNEEYKKKFRDDRVTIDELLENATFRRLFASQFAEQYESVHAVPIHDSSDQVNLPVQIKTVGRFKKTKDERKIRALDRRAAKLANLHTIISSPRGEFFRFRLLQILEVEKSMAELIELKKKEPIKELGRHLQMLQETFLIAETITDGKRTFKRTTKGEAAINAIRALGRRVGEETFSSILHANFDANCIRLFLRAYGYKKELNIKKPHIEFTPYEVGKIAMFLDQNVLETSVIDKLNSAGILEYIDDGMIRMNSQKAQAIFQYWVDLYRIINKPIIFEYLLQPPAFIHSAEDTGHVKSEVMQNGEEY